MLEEYIWEQHAPGSESDHFLDSPRSSICSTSTPSPQVELLVIKFLVARYLDGLVCRRSDWAELDDRKCFD